jgi:transposase InsO family protein/transposase-like protein
MPWKERSVPDERLRFVIACLEDDRDSMAALCRRFGVSRRVGYKWLSRYKELGPAGLAERSRAPRSSPHRVAADVERRILSMRADHPTWGARKLLAALARRAGRDGESAAIDWPVASTVGEMLRRAGLAAPRCRRDRSAWAPPGPASAPAVGAASAVAGPNRLWCADFKGWFRCGDGARCQPLTVTDAHSRYLIRCQPLPDTSGRAARPAFEAAFREFGLPDAIRTDNGSPFASTGLLGLSQLSVWWLRLGIAHDRIDPGRPEQNGSHERMHLTLKREAADPPAATLRAQRARLDAWRREYNDERPHEGLPAMATPASLYAPSPRPLPARLNEVEYPPTDARRHVDSSGRFTWGGATVFLSHALERQTVGLRDLAADAADAGRYFAVRFVTVELGVLDATRARLLTPRQRRHLAW